MRQQAVPASAVNRGQTLLNNKYEKLEAVGHGAYGNVFKGRDSSNGELVAIKEVKLTGSTAEHLHDVMSEIDLLKSLNHEHIVKYLDSFKTRSHLYIILEFMENGDLSSALKPNKFGVFPEPLAAVYIAQVLQGLVYLHEQGVVHRDIKGANILTTSEGLVKLADFGVATNLEAAGQEMQDVVGTPYWMAPEVIEMTEVTAGSDVWSVGCLVVELLTGHPPYYELQPMSALFRIVQDVHPPLPEGISTHMEDFLLLCFQKEARQRPDAQTLLTHPWIRTNKKQNIRATWGRAQGTRARGGRMHANVSSVMNLFLESGAEGEDEEEEDTMLAAGSEATLPAYKGETPSESPLWTPDAPSPEFHSRSRSHSSIVVESGFGSITTNPLLSERAIHISTQNLGRLNNSGRGTWTGPGPSGLGRQPVSADDLQVESERTSPHHQQGGREQLSPFLQRQHVAMGSGELPMVEDQQTPGKGTVMRLLLDSRLGGPTGSQPDLLAWALSGGMEGGGPGVAGPPGGVHTPLGTRFLSHIHSLEGAEQSPKVGVSPAASKQFGAAEGDRDKLAEMRRDKDEVKRLISSLRLESSGWGAGGGGGGGAEMKVLDACQKLVSLLPNSPARKVFFLENSGPVAVLELLHSGDVKVVQAGLELVNAVASNDVAVMESLSLIGMVPAVARFAESDSSTPVREQAALFIHQLCLAAPQTQQMLIACSGLPLLVRLVEVDYKAHRGLVRRGVSCIWHILESHGPGGSLNDFCRLLAHHGLAERLVLSLSSASQESRSAIGLAGGSANHSPSLSVTSQAAGGGSPLNEGAATGGLEHPGPGGDRLASHSRASSSERVRIKRVSRGLPSAGSEVEMGTVSVSDQQTAQDATLLLDKTANLLLVFSIADSVVKRHLCRRETLGQLFDTVPNLEAGTALKVLRCIKHLTMDENMLAMLQGPEIIRRLVMLLDSQVMGGIGGGAASSSPSSSPPTLPSANGSSHHASQYATAMRLAASGEEHQLEVVHALYNLCRINKQCQERAAVEGAVRSLCKLAEHRPDSNPKLRTLAISMLCRLAHASSASRAQLWQANALAIFLRLTSETRWQAPAMDAIATWLAEDLVRIEPRLLQSDSLQTFTSVFELWKQQLAAGAGVGELKGLLEIFHRILATSRRLNVALSGGTLPGVAVAMLREELPMTSLPLLKILRSLYEAHPHPKEFIIQHGIHKAVQGLAEGEKAALVAKQAQNLLDAFQINSIL